MNIKTDHRIALRNDATKVKEIAERFEDEYGTLSRSTAAKLFQHMEKIMGDMRDHIARMKTL